MLNLLSIHIETKYSWIYYIIIVLDVYRIWHGRTWLQTMFYIPDEVNVERVKNIKDWRGNRMGDGLSLCP